MGSILTLNEDNFDEEIRRPGVPILVDFWASWCSPCKAVAPVLEELAREFAGRAIVGKVDVDENGDLTNRYGIRSVPTLVLFQDGNVVDQLVGAAPISALRGLIESRIGP